jgi:zinc D-Ala-D-Ala carboxypeptidase
MRRRRGWSGRSPAAAASTTRRRERSVRARSRAPLVVVALAIASLVLPATPSPETPVPLPDDLGVRLAPELPACRYDDVLTRYRTYDRHDVTLLDTIYKLTAAYAPPDLVSVSQAGLSGGGSIRRIALPDLKALASAARVAGAPLRVVSAYRSYSQQASTFNYWVRVGGYRSALLASARAGHSEHQLGTSLDFASAGGPDPWKLSDWATTKAGAWMLRNAWRYGFVLSYPKGKSPAVTCYKYEPWHYRWVGRKRADEIRRANTTTRQYLWRYQ